MGGIPLQELNALELDFIQRIDFRLSVPETELYEALRTIAACKESTESIGDRESPPMPCSFRLLRAHVHPQWVI